MSVQVTPYLSVSSPSIPGGILQDAEDALNTNQRTFATNGPFKAFCRRLSIETSENILKVLPLIFESLNPQNENRSENAKEILRILRNCRSDNIFTAFLRFDPDYKDYLVLFYGAALIEMPERLMLLMCGKLNKLYAAIYKAMPSPSLDILKNMQMEAQVVANCFNNILVKSYPDDSRVKAITEKFIFLLKFPPFIEALDDLDFPYFITVTHLMLFENQPFASDCGFGFLKNLIKYGSDKQVKMIDSTLKIREVWEKAISSTNDTWPFEQLLDAYNKRTKPVEESPEAEAPDHKEVV